MEQHRYPFLIPISKINIKKKKGQRIEKCFWLEKDKEGKLLNERFSVYRQSPIRYYLLNQKQNFKNQKLIF